MSPQRVNAVDVRDHVIRIRASQRQLDLIDRAARVLNTSRSEFIRETMCRESERVVLDQVHFQLDDKAFAQFNAMLDAPPAPTEALRTLLLTKTSWNG